MAGSSIAGRGAAAWVTDFLNAAYYRRPAEDRDVDDLRLAFCILTTYWYRNEAREPAAPRRPAGVPPRVRPRALRRRGGLLDREALLRGASALLGDWFPAAYADDGRRAWGIAFRNTTELEAVRPLVPAWSWRAWAS